MKARTKLAGPATRRRFLAAAGSGAMLALNLPPFVRTVRAQTLPNLPVWAASGGITELTWSVIKARRLDEKHGVVINLTSTDASAVNQALVVGQVAVGSSEPMTTAIANASGREITLFGPNLWNHCSLIVPKTSAATTMKDLIGKKLATLAQLSGTYTSCQVIAALQGLDFEKQFQILTGPPPAVVAFLERGDVDGAILFEPIVGNLVESGKYKAIMGLNQVWKDKYNENMFFGGIAADQKWLDVNTALAKSLAAMMIEAGHVIRTDPSVFTQFAKALNLQNDAEIAVARQRIPPFVADSWGPAAAQSAMRLIGAAADLGLVKKPTRNIVVSL